MTMRFSAAVIALVCVWAQLLPARAIASQGVENAPTMRLHYVNFGVAPYSAQTREDIERRPLYEIWFYGRNPFNEELVSTLERVPIPKSTLDGKVIRLVVSIAWPKKAVYVVDEHGTVVEEISGSMFRLDRAIMSSLDGRITSYHGVVDQWPGRDVWGEDTEEWYPVKK